MMQISEKAKKIAAAIVFIGILMSAAAWAGYSIGKDQGIAYQKEQPVVLHVENIHVNSTTHHTEIVRARDITVTPEGALYLSLDSRSIIRNNVTKFKITI